eukprot:GHRQ01016171.1.p2 GENE.GHRQ01016171.1~~GHRQ01016171.1.p2  ORF type:complete len:107 (-),score=28.41 GHRQ01016171.1:1362-1682(-)
MKLVSHRVRITLLECRSTTSLVKPRTAVLLCGCGCLQAPQLFLQFITRYMHWSGQMRCRVTTLTRYWTDGSNSADLINGFDQVRAAQHQGDARRAWILYCMPPCKL